MALEFKTKDESYKSYRFWPSGTTVWRAKIFVDTLPPGFPTCHYNPYLITDRYSHRLRYVINTHILIYQNSLILEVVLPAGIDTTPQEMFQVVMNNSIERNALDVILVHQGCEYQGALSPIPETTAEACHPPQSPFVKRQRRHP
jgi:hypothetical protein